MFEFFRIADKQVDKKTATQNGYLEAFKADTVARVNELLSKVTACTAAWRARNAFRAEVNAHSYPNGLGHAAQYIDRLALMHDPLQW
jgi:hypothetical protein